MFWVWQDIAPFDSIEERGSGQVETIQKIRKLSWMKLELIRCKFDMAAKVGGREQIEIGEWNIIQKWR